MQWGPWAGRCRKEALGRRKHWHPERSEGPCCECIVAGPATSTSATGSLVASLLGMTNVSFSGLLLRPHSYCSRNERRINRPARHAGTNAATTPITKQRRARRREGQRIDRLHAEQERRQQPRERDRADGAMRHGPDGTRPCRTTCPITCVPGRPRRYADRPVAPAIATRSVRSRRRSRSRQARARGPTAATAAP